MSVEDNAGFTVPVGLASQPVPATYVNRVTLRGDRPCHYTIRSLYNMI